MVMASGDWCLGMMFLDWGVGGSGESGILCCCGVMWLLEVGGQNVAISKQSASLHLMSLAFVLAILLSMKHINP